MHQRRKPPTTSDTSTEIHVVSSTSLSTILMKWIQSPKLKLGLLLWLFGIVFMLVVPSPFPVTPEQEKQFDQTIYQATNLEGYQEAVYELQEATAYVNEVKVWFWRFRSPYKEMVDERSKVLHEKEQKIAQYAAQRDQLIRTAKQQVGLWSSYGFDEMRTRFWDAFEAGKVFAQRHTFWEMIFHAMSAREESVVSLVLHWVFTALINFTFSLLGSLFYFVFSLGSMIYSYQPDPLSAVTFYVLGIVGAAAVIATYLVGMYGMAASGIYMVGKMAVRDARLRYQEQERLRHRYD